jgi:hypothetical protein
MAINCLSPISPSAFIRTRVWVEVVTKANTIYASAGVTGTGYFTCAASQPFIDLISLYPFSPYKGRKGIIDNNYNSLSSYLKNYFYYLTRKYDSFFLKI